VSKYNKSPWGGNMMVDDTALLLGGDGERCTDCHNGENALREVLQEQVTLH
jgi:aminoglycoside N3'-acetyltransferase